MTGGPGCSSELALFFENGPYTVTKKFLQPPELHDNPFSWNKKANVIWIGAQFFFLLSALTRLADRKMCRRGWISSLSLTCVARAVSSFWFLTLSASHVVFSGGTGFSTVQNTLGYATNEAQVAADMLTFLQGFYAQYPQCKIA